MPRIPPSTASLDSRLEIRHLRYFRAVAEELSFSRASERLHIAQPPLSQQIKQLEVDLGVLLLERKNRPLRLTEAGQYFLERAQEILVTLQRTVEETRRIGHGLTGTINIGFAGSAMYNLLPSMVNAYRDRYPMIELNFKEMLAAEIQAALEARQVDIGFSRPGIDVSNNLEQILLINEPLVVAASVRHPLSGDGIFKIEQLNDENIILYPRHPRPSLTDLILTTLETRGTNIRIIQEVSNLQTALGLVAAGVGITFVPESVGTHDRAGIRFLALEPKVLFSPLTAVWRQDSQSTALHNFLETMSKHITGEGTATGT